MVRHRRKAGAWRAEAGRSAQISGSAGMTGALAWIARGLSRDEAARYVGVGPTKFDEMVSQHLLPGPKRIGRRTVWDRVALDIAFSALPGDEDGSIEALIE